MKDLLNRLWQRFSSVLVDQAQAKRILDEITPGTALHYRVKTSGANLKIAGTQVQIPAGSLAFDSDVELAPLTHGNVVAGIRMACSTDFRVPIAWSLPNIGMVFSIRYPGDYVVVKAGKRYQLVELEGHRARVAVAA